MAKCIFCKDDINVGTGIKFVQKDGKVLDFCSRKCEKNMLHLGRKGRETRWSGDYKKE